MELVHGTVNGVQDVPLSETVIRKEVIFNSDGSGGWVAVDRRAKMEMVIENEVGGTNLVIGRLGDIIERLPPRAQQFFLNLIFALASKSAGLDWDGEIEIRFN